MQLNTGVYEINTQQAYSADTLIVDPQSLTGL